MPATVNQSSIVRTSVGNKFRITGTLAFTTYETGGPAITGPFLELDQIEWFELENQGGYVWDPIISTNQNTVNLKGYTATGGGVFVGTPMAPHSHGLVTIVDEAVAVAMDTGTLAQAPALVQDVFVTAGAVMGPFLIIPDGAPASGQAAINMTTGVITFNAADAVTAAEVTYLSKVTGGQSAGTPAGTITPTGGSSEIPNGTDLSGLGQIPFECTGI